MSEATLGDKEFHPAASSALLWFRTIPITEYALMVESLASNAIEGNRLAEICLSTIRRLENGQPVSDRYLLGLCWTLKMLQDESRLRKFSELREQE